jgi:hypothetical protein
MRNGIQYDQSSRECVTDHLFTISRFLSLLNNKVWTILPKRFIFIRNYIGRLNAFDQKGNRGY